MLNLTMCLSVLFILVYPLFPFILQAMSLELFTLAVFVSYSSYLTP